MTFSKMRTMAALTLAAATFYTGDPGTSTLAGGGGNDTLAGGGGTGGGGTGGGGSGDRTYTQAELQAELNKRDQQAKKEVKERNQQIAQELERVKNQASTTQEERDRLQSQIDSLTAETQTKEEQHKDALGKLQKKFDETQTKLSTESRSWRGKYEQKVLETEIRDAAKHPEHEAFSEKQVFAMLQPFAFFKEETGSDGKPTGVLIPQIKFQGRNKEDGKPVELILSPKEAVKAMSEMEEYANLFKNGAKSGFGNQNNADNGTGNTRVDLETMSDADYEKWRSNGLAQVK